MGLWTTQTSSEYRYLYICSIHYNCVSKRSVKHTARKLVLFYIHISPGCKNTLLTELEVNYWPGDRLPKVTKGIGELYMSCGYNMATIWDAGVETEANPPTPEARIDLRLDFAMMACVGPWQHVPLFPQMPGDSNPSVRSGCGGWFDTRPPHTKDIKLGCLRFSNWRLALIS